ncbi:pseudouridine synthase [Bosea sp. TND4EK4]|uniref:pseudouridine synthase n=1 Tax=Bosea sp. TND4EK4 TaxID=1907408 RepID=UPI000955CADD|nr:23S rRNA pseudouridine2605 synthase [Bosea sp. TND4EK4]
MADDDNSKGRGPRKGGGGGSRGGQGSGGPGSGSRGFGSDRAGGKSFGGKSFGAKRPAGAGARSFGERGGEGRSAPPRDGAERKDSREEGERRPFRGPAEGMERPARRFDKPAGDRPPRPRSEGEARPFRARSSEDRPRSAERGAERGFRPRGETAERPARAAGPRREGGERSFDRPRTERGPRPERSERASRSREEAPAESKLIVAQEPERIAKVMARAGVASRRDSEAMIAEGRVSVNGQVLESPAYDVKPTDAVLVDGEPLPARERTRLWLFHKPRGVVTTNFDPEGRPTVFDTLPEDLPRVLTIGRLDINTEGLLLLTNDGGLARVLELPETGWLRRYRVRAFGEVTQDVLDTVKDGVTIEGVHYGPVAARFERQQGFNTWLTVDLREGKNREVKTVLEHLGLTVNRLIRISFGPFQLGDMPEGEVEEIRSRVLQDQLGTELTAKAGADFETPRRDALPTAPPRREAPAAEDRPRRRNDGARRDEAPPTQRPRGDKPWTRGVWRDEDEAQRPRKAPPRRGADPKLERESREASGEVARRRDKAIADPKGRRVLVERVSSTREEAPAEPESRRRPDRKPRNERGEARPARSVERSSGDRPVRRPREEAGGRDRTDERPWQERPGQERRGQERPRQDRAPRSDRPARDGAERPARRFGDKPAGDRPRGRSFGDKPAGGRPFGGKPGGGRPGGGRPGGGRPSGAGKGPRPGGPRGQRD